MVDSHTLEEIAKRLIAHNLTIATAESCTGGLLAHTLTNISGSSEYFECGVISYSNQSKIELLGVSKQTLEDHGAVSIQIAKEMAIGIRDKSNVDIGLSTTGIAGPTGGTKMKPVGLVYIGIATPTDIEVKRFLFSGNREQNKDNACNAALELLLRHIPK